MSTERGRALRRQWRLIVLLRQRRRTLPDLAEQLGVTTRTIRRDLEVLESVGVALGKEEASVDPRHPDQYQPAYWFLAQMPEWPWREPAPIAELRS